MGILKDVFNGKKGMTGIVSEEQEKKFPCFVDTAY